jgi:CHRD domain
MTRRKLLLFAALVLVATTGIVFADHLRDLRAHLNGFQEVPTLSSSGVARFDARISRDEREVRWRLSYARTESDVTQAHIHFSAPALNGPIVVFLCTNLGNGPAGTQMCPAAPATISGTFTSVDVLANAATQGLEGGNLAELIAALRAGATYANVHTSERPGGEMRGQIFAHDNRRGH